MEAPIGLSVLVPVYNTDVRELINQLAFQCANCQRLAFEIRVYDDASAAGFRELNAIVETYKGVVYKPLPANLGRSAIRNLLAREAVFSFLLFLDGDVLPCRSNFIAAYAAQISSGQKAISGGTNYVPEMPQGTNFRLHWKVGKSREEKTAAQRNAQPYAGFTLNNLLIERNTFLAIGLDETITTYGHEDTRFGYAMQGLRWPVMHIDNPVFHLGLNTNSDFLAKSAQAVQNLHRLVADNGIGSDIKLVKAYRFLEKYRLRRFYLFFYKCFEKPIVANLISASPSVRFFDFYKLNVLVGCFLSSKVSKN